MKIVLIVVLILTLVLMEAVVHGSPAHAGKFAGWKNAPRTTVSYRERLQSWGLYPKVFRYGTANHHRAWTLSRKKDELHWVKRLVREHEDAQDDEFRAADSNAIDKNNTIREQYEKFKEKLFQKMEQDAMEILWQHR